MTDPTIDLSKPRTYDHDEEQMFEKFFTENEVEIAENKPFELVGTLQDEFLDPAKAPPAEVLQEEVKKRESTLQRVGKMSVGERVKQAFIGNKEERAILVRDGSRVVFAAVIASPKLTESEVENFAGLKNVQEGVLREIARNRKYVKKYPVQKALINNPRCPLDLGLGFIKNLLPPDLKTLSQNKNVSETIRKIALKTFKEKTAPPGSKGGG
jgi:hypothetical protein